MAHNGFFLLAHRLQSLQSGMKREWGPNKQCREIKPQSVQFNQFWHSFVLLKISYYWEIKKRLWSKVKPHMWKIAMTNTSLNGIGRARTSKMIVSTVKSQQTRTKYNKLTANTMMYSAESFIFGGCFMVLNICAQHSEVWNLLLLLSYIQHFNRYWPSHIIVNQ